MAIPIQEILPQVTDQSINQAHQQPELKRQKTGDEERFLAAIESPKIKNSHIDDLKTVLKGVMVKIGLRDQNWPVEEEKALLLSHIIKEYGNHTVAEIALAFDMAIGGKLCVDTDKGSAPVDANCYENFSCLYFSSIMNAYRKWAAEAYRQNVPEVPKLEAPKEELGDIAMKEWLADVKKSKTQVELLPVMLYDWLDKKGEIKKTGPEKKEYMQKGVQHLHQQLLRMSLENPAKYKPELDQFLKMKEAGRFEGIILERLKKVAKRMILHEYIFSGPNAD